MKRATNWLRQLLGRRQAQSNPDATPVVGQQSDVSALLSDAPLSNPEQDRLGRAPFAEALARAIVGLQAPEGFVFALYAPWGAGKSSTLNFVLYHVERMASPSEIVILRFDPWWYAGDEQLVLQFFRQLMLALGRPDVPERLRRLGGTLETFAKVVAPLSHVPFLKEWAEPVRQALRASGESVREAGEDLAKDAQRLRRDIDKVLRQQSARILIVIDDLDRLSRSEIQQMFRLMKAVADFPRTIYLLAFDRAVVATALSEVQHGDGQDYLEKIVQAPFDLPPPDEAALRGLLFEQLDLVLGQPDPELWDQVAWGNVFLEGIAHFIQTPRDVKRYVNALRVAYPAVKGEVNPIDFLAIECLRVFAPAVYHAVRANKDLFTGSDDRLGAVGPKPEDLRKQYEGILEAAEPGQRDPVQAILSRTFTRFASAFGAPHYGSEWETEWRKKLMVRSKDIFDIYFRLSVPLGTISSAEMRSILASAGDSEVFERELIRLAGERRPDGTSRARAFLERLQDYTKQDIPPEHIEPIVRAFFNAGDQLVIPEDEVGFFAFGNDVYVVHITCQLLMRLPSHEQRFQLLHSVLPTARALYTTAHCVSAIRQEHEEGKKRTPPRSDEECTVAEEHLQPLTDIAIRKIKAAAADGTLATVPHLAYMLYAWREWAGQEALSEYLTKTVETDEGLARFLEGFLQAERAHGMGDSVGRVNWRVRPKAVADFVADTDALCGRAAGILKEAPDWLTDRQRIALSAFVDECRNPSKYRYD